MELQSIGSEYAGGSGISVFYQVSARPLYTVNGEHYVSQLIELCGGTNVFADLGELAPAVDVVVNDDFNNPLVSGLEFPDFTDFLGVPPALEVCRIS